jgi:hypothetical protein
MSSAYSIVEESRVWIADRHQRRAEKQRGNSQLLGPTTSMKISRCGNIRFLSIASSDSKQQL